MGKDDILQNLVFPEDLAMNGSLPWRGAREKSHVLFNMIIESCSRLGDVILDATANTG